ncbi:MAG: methionine synthase [Dehalococcoidia bacterium]|nr:methionine synthase [Dehalococcoidia bacterium]
MSTPTTRSDRIARLKALLQERLIVLDGAMGTTIQARNLAAADFGGPQYEGCNEFLVITRPDVIADIHRTFLDAGADIIETDTFGGTPLVLGEYGLADRAHEINRVAAQLARRAADEAATPERPRFVAGSIGPTTKTLSVTGGVTFDALADSFQVQAEGLLEGGVDLLLVETSQDALNCKAALVGIDRAMERTGITVPIALQATIEAMGTTLGGQDIEAFYTTFAHRDLLWVGLNCATGPDFMTDHIRTLAAMSRFPVACIPNAGLPDENGRYSETPEKMRDVLARFEQQGWLNVVGGCCGTVPDHIRLLAEESRKHRPRPLAAQQETRVSGLDALVVEPDNRPVIVGERTNVLGSRKFKRLIAEGKLDEAAEVGREQVKWGAQVLDVCLQDPDRNESADVRAFLNILTKKVKAPIMLDTTDSKVLAEALKLTPGKCIINSINLEDGEARFQAVVPLARQYGAALIVGCIDDDKQQAQAVTRERKLAVATRSYKLLTEQYGVPPEDIIFDPLVFPVGTGDQNYVGAGVETIEGVRLIKRALPRAKTILGISNVSFGLPTTGREVLNAVFLYHCVQAGLDMAIVNSERLERFASIPENERKLADDLIFGRGDDAIAAFAAHFRGRVAKANVRERDSMTLDERLANYILEGSRVGLVEDLDEALKTRRPLAIINGPLMAGMDEVGRLFNANQMIVAEVLQSAEAMKAAVSHLEPHMEKAESATRGKVILATVKGDVHDIGKNLVDIILSNNGYRVINLGIKVPPQDLIAAYRQHKPDFIGLSGLLVKSAQMMVETAQEFRQAGVSVPLLVGGAALTNKFTRLRIAPEYGGLTAYARDAMDGLALANRLRDPAQRDKLADELADVTRSMQAASAATEEPSQAPTEHRSSSVRADVPIPTPPDLDPHVLHRYDLREVFSYVNPVMLYTRHLGFRGRFEDALAAGDPKAMELRDAVQRVENNMAPHPDIHADAVYRFFRAASDGRWLLILSPDGKREMERFYFGRQAQGDGLCLSDYVSPTGSGKADYVAMFVTTVGPGVRALADKLREQGEFLRSHILQVLALEGAEALAERLHQKLRAAWGFPDRPDIPKPELFQGRYQGKRYSFGYPACPRLEDQAKLFPLLDVEHHIGVKLTEGFMMDPESSVSALVMHHPDAKYFNLSASDIDRLEREVAATEPATPLPS